MSKPYSLIICAVTLFQLFLKPAQAQNVWTNQRINSISAEVIKPGFDIPGDLKFVSSTWFLSGNLRLNDKLSISPELPVSFFKAGGFESQTTIGNIAARLFFHPDTSKVSFEFAVFLPTTADNKPNATIYGLLSDFNRHESFNTDRYGISAHSNFHHTISRNFFVKARAGLLYQINGNDTGEGFLFLDYGLILGYQDDKILLKTGISGRTLVSEEGDFDIFAERAVEQFGFSFSANSGRIRPGISVRIPMDDEFNRVLNNSIGVHVNYLLK